jgi:hypothetical protein
MSTKRAGEVMYEFVRSGGRIDEVRERRPEWKDLVEFRYDLRLCLEKGEPEVYVETLLVNDSRVDPPHIQVVNVHWVKE